MRRTGAGREGREGGRRAAGEEKEEGGAAPSAAAPSGHFRTWRDPLNPRLEALLTAVRASRRGLDESGRGGRVGPEEGDALTTWSFFFFPLKAERESETAAFFCSRERIDCLFFLSHLFSSHLEHGHDARLAAGERLGHGLGELGLELGGARAREGRRRRECRRNR